MKNKIIMVVASISLLSLSACGFGYFNKPYSSDGQFQDRIFSYYDDNSDGYVDKNEYLAVHQSRFTRTDDNEDGKILLEEVQNSRIYNFQPTRMKMWFSNTDLNQDGSVDSDEVKQVTNAEFVAMDSNQDKKLSKEEMVVYRKQQDFLLIDTNKDGLISQKEFNNYSIR